jgi:hypothetical protein
MRPLVLFDWDVLARTPDGTLASAIPVEGGVDLYQLLASRWRLVLTFRHVSSPELLRSWLVREGLKAHVGLDQYSPDCGLDAATWRLSNARSYRTVGNDELLVVDTDPALVAELTADGVAAMLVSFPSYQFRGRTLQGWDSLVEEIDRQRELRN